MWLDGPSKGTPTIEDVTRVLGESCITTKAADPAFEIWILNKRELAEQLSYLAGLSMGVIEDVLLSDDSKPSDKLKAVALVNDLVKASAPKQEVKYLDAGIADMTEEEIDKLLEGK